MKRGHKSLDNEHLFPKCLDMVWKSSRSSLYKKHKLPQSNKNDPIWSCVWRKGPQRISENDQELAHNETYPDAHEDLNKCAVQQEQPQKWQKLTESQEKINNQRIKQT